MGATLQQQLSTRTIIIVALLAFIIGLGLLYWSASMAKPWDNIVRELGAMLLVTVSLGVLWEFLGKRMLVDEVLEKVRISTDIQRAGVLQIVDNFHDLEWKGWFEHATNLTVFVAYGHTWFRSHAQELQSLVARSGCRIHVLLPDPAQPELLSALARRFAMTPEDLRKRIEEAVRNYHALEPVKDSTVEVTLVKSPPLFTFYMFENVAIFVPHSHRSQAPVPAFVVREGGSLYNYLCEELDALVKSGIRLERPRDGASNT